MPANKLQRAPAAASATRCNARAILTEATDNVVIVGTRNEPGNDGRTLQASQKAPVVNLLFRIEFMMKTPIGHPALLRYS